MITPDDHTAVIILQVAILIMYVYWIFVNRWAALFVSIYTVFATVASIAILFFGMAAAYCWIGDSALTELNETFKIQSFFTTAVNGDVWGSNRVIMSMLVTYVTMPFMVAIDIMWNVFSYCVLHGTMIQTICWFFFIGEVAICIAQMHERIQAAFGR